ncbi:AHH domain-containing protein [Microbulbifer sp. EKSA008]|uniref:AHH domain-containing protein n=1 Tax=unclassified Microbulbifer TaxID=2619833 RepID=UPI00404207C8
MIEKEYIEIDQETLYEGIKSISKSDFKAKEILATLIEAQQEEVEAAIEHKKKKRKTSAQIAIEKARRRHMRKLKRNMRNASPSRPQPKKYMAAHHIVSWHDSRALAARQILAQYGIDINDESNGVWLPQYEKDLPHKACPDAYAHAKIHTNVYYVNVTNLLQTEARIPGTSANDIRDVLRDIGDELVSGVFPV